MSSPLAEGGEAAARLLPTGRCRHLRLDGADARQQIGGRAILDALAVVAHPERATGVRPLQAREFGVGPAHSDVPLLEPTFAPPEPSLCSRWRSRGRRSLR